MIKYKEYPSYDEYIKRQAKKLDVQYKRKTNEWNKRYKKYRKHFKQFRDYCKSSIICLGARLGEEVAVFRKYGYEAIGVDINPGGDNPYVVKGDFHNLTYANNSFTTAYSNSLDHSNDLRKMFAEAARVTTGCFIIELHDYKRIGAKEYECAVWDRDEDVLQLADEYYTVLKRFPKDSVLLPSYVLKKRGVE